MARRFPLGALIAAIVAAWPVSAFPATAPADAPQLVTANFVSPALLQWIPGDDPGNVSQTVRRAPGRCADTDGPAVAVMTYEDNTTSQHFAHPADGVWCFSIRANDRDGDRDESPGRTVRIDTTPPAATVAVSRLAPGGVVNGTIRISGTSSDEFSGVAGRAFHVGAVGACASGPVVPTSWNTAGIPNGAYDVCTVATDVAGNVGTASLTVVVSNPVPPMVTPAVVAPPATAPPVAPQTGPAAKAPSRLVLVMPRQKGRAPILRWKNPAGSDHVVVVFNRRRAPRAPDDGQVIYRGRGTSVKLALHAGQRANVALYAVDHAGGVSAPARRVVSLAALLPLRPITGSSVTEAPRLSWKPRRGAAYYNVQVFFRGKRVLVGWPRRPSYRPPKRALHAGTYVWFVWPAFKGRGAGAKFSQLIGRATFVYKK